MCERLQADAAASLLADALAPAEWAVFRHVAGLMRAALAPEAAAANGLTAPALSALLSDLWFGPTPHSYRGKGEPMTALGLLCSIIGMMRRQQTSWCPACLEPLH